MIVLYFSHTNQGRTQKLTRTSEWNAKKSVSLMTISGNKITDLLLSPLSTGWMIVLYFSHINQGRTHKLTRTSEWNAKKYKKIFNDHLRQ